MKEKVIVVNERNDGGCNPRNVEQMPRCISKELRVVEFFLRR